MKQTAELWIEELGQLCERIGECRVRVEQQQEGRVLLEKLSAVVYQIRQELDISCPELLIALMDTYEVTRDEVMLQQILDVVSGQLEQLEVLPVNVKLLAYCYYYVEEQECAVKAKEMLEILRRKEKNTDGLKEAEKAIAELIED